MSPIGHSLVGLAFASIAISPSCSRIKKVCMPIVFVALANLPDWPIPNWGHDRYDISHSIYVNIALIFLLIFCWSFSPKVRSNLQLRYVLLGGAAWLSHLLLDSFYNHGNGIGVYWPFSDAHLNLSMPWFNTLDLSQSVFGTHNLSVYATEFVAYFPLLLLAIAFSYITRSRDSAVAT